ncbi:hypothetical protein [Asticcacaulis sp. W401b]|uniref:hypothetical protein n=1 Tax=Asticcacaulis sp. W401b TaxID=3388666 RepID=UPI003970F537
MAAQPLWHTMSKSQNRGKKSAVLKSVDASDVELAQTASPALILQDHVAQSFAEEKKTPFGWTLLGLVAFCGTFWALLALLIWH